MSRGCIKKVKRLNLMSDCDLHFIALIKTMVNRQTDCE